MTPCEAIYEMTRDIGHVCIERAGDTYIAIYEVDADCYDSDEQQLCCHGFSIAGKAETPDEAVRKLYELWNKRASGLGEHPEDS